MQLISKLLSRIEIFDGGDLRKSIPDIIARDYEWLMVCGVV
jgi:hypothetical protein